MRKLSPTVDRATLAVGFLVLYLGWLSSRYNLDGIVYAFNLGKAVAGDFSLLWHPHHLLYGPFTYLFYRAIAPAGFGYLLSMQLLNALFGAGCLFLFHRTAMAFLPSRFAAGIATAGLGGSYIFWFYSIEPEVYVPHTFFTLLALGLLLGVRKERSTGQTPGDSLLRAAAAGPLIALIGATHVSGLALAPGIMLAQWWPQDAARPRFDRAGGRRLLAAALTAAAALAVLYAIGASMDPDTRRAGVTQWFLGRTLLQTGDVTSGRHWSLPPESLILLANGFRRSLLARASFGEAALVALALLLVIYLVSLRRLLAERPRQHGLFLAFYLPAFAFFSVWEPVNPEMKVVLLPAVWLAAGTGASVATRWRGPRLAVFLAVVILLLGLNGSQAIVPGSNPANNHNLIRSWFIRDHTEDNAVVYISGKGDFNDGKIYILFFAGREKVVADWAMQGPDPVAELAASLAGHRGRPVYVTRDLADPGSETFRQLAASHRVDPGRLTALFAGRLQPVGGRPDGEPGSGPFLFRYLPP